MYDGLMARFAALGFVTSGGGILSLATPTPYRVADGSYYAEITAYTYSDESPTDFGSYSNTMGIFVSAGAFTFKNELGPGLSGGQAGSWFVQGVQIGLGELGLQLQNRSGVDRTIHCAAVIGSLVRLP